MCRVFTYQRWHTIFPRLAPNQRKNVDGQGRWLLWSHSRLSQRTPKRTDTGNGSS